MSFHAPEKYREITGKLATTKEAGPNGVFHIPIYKDRFFTGRQITIGNLQCIASNEKGWEHLTVAVVNNSKSEMAKRKPTIDEIEKVKNLFWDDTDTVVIFFPDKTKYHNPFPTVVHLWRQIGSIYSLPTEIMTGNA